jgi:hypothetical protein
VIWRVYTSHIQAQAARHQAQAAHHQAQTAREGHYTDLFTKAVEQLGTTREVKRNPPNHDPVVETEPNLEVRLGAIYALERIAVDSERDHWPIMEVLCAYIRNPQNGGTSRVDVQAALTVIGRRPSHRVAHEISLGLSLDLSGADLRGANLIALNFAEASFVGANFEGASLLRTNLRGASFQQAHLTGAGFYEADLRGTDLWDADGLTQAALVHANGDALTLLPPYVERPASWPKEKPIQTIALVEELPLCDDLR